MLIVFSILSLAFGHSGSTDTHGCHAGTRPYHCHKNNSAPQPASTLGAFKFLYNDKSVRAVCRDGTLSSSTSKTEACINNGGVYQWLEDAKKEPIIRTASPNNKLKQSLSKKSGKVAIGTVLKQIPSYRYGYELAGYTPKGEPQFVFVLNGLKRPKTAMTPAMRAEALELLQKERRLRRQQAK